MNKSELIDAIATQTDTSKAQTGEILDATIEAITKAVTGGETVQLIGFGSFSPGNRAARTGRNPTTGAEIRIPAARTVKFAAGNACEGAGNARKQREERGTAE